MRPQISVRRRRGAAAGIPVALIALIALTGCGAIDDLIPVTSASEAGTAGVTLGQGTDVFALAVGDCLNTPGGDLHTGVRLVPCADGHDWEIYFEAVVPGAGSAGEEYPGNEVLMAAAEAQCGAQFGPFLGLDPAGGAAAAAVAELGYTYLTPSEDDWSARADHGVSCLIGNMSGPVAGSLAGAAG